MCTLSGRKIVMSVVMMFVVISSVFAVNAGDMDSEVLSLLGEAPIEVAPQRSVIVMETVPEDPGALRGSDSYPWEAARDLQKHLELVTEVEIPIVDLDSVAEGDYPFYVNIHHPEDTAELAVGEVRWVVSEDGVWIYGNDEEAERGSMMAVYDFLERQLGARWIEPGDEGVYVRWQNPLVLEPGAHSWRPTLVNRRTRRGILPRSVPYRYDSVLRKELVESHNRRVDETNVWSHRMKMGGRNPAATHSFSDWWERFGETNPEYFALNEHGERAPIPGARRAESWIKICPSNPAVAEQLIEDWLPRKDDRRIVMAGINDGQFGFCRCDDCRALDVTKENESWDDHLTDRYVVLANRVARMAREHREGAQVSMYAYMTTLDPPRRERLEPNIMVTVVPYVDPLDPEVVEEHFEGWREAGATQFVFRPNYPHKYFKTSIPIGIEEYYFDVFRTAYEKGVVAATYDNLRHNWPVTGMAEYILAKAMSEPDKPFSHWEEHYCAGYGGASEQVKEYFRYWREQVWEERLHPDLYEILSRAPGGDFDWGLMRSPGPYYETEDFDRTDAILERALEAVHTGAERDKVMQLVRANQHARLVFNVLVAEEDQKKAPAEELRRFRNLNKVELPLAWGNIGWFERRRLNNATGVQVRYEDEDGNRLRHRVWDVISDE